MEPLDLIPLALLLGILAFWALWGFLIGALTVITARIILPTLRHKDHP